MLSEQNLASNKIESLMSLLNESWKQLESDVKLKQDRLEQATKARAFSSAFDDFTMWCDQIKNVLASQELGDNLSSVKFLRAKHQVRSSVFKKIGIIVHASKLDVFLNVRLL